MFPLVIEEREFYNEASNEFVTVPGAKILLEHSLFALSAWESKWNKPFITEKPKSREEMISYVECMTLNPNDVPPYLYGILTPSDLNKVQRYIDSPQTATRITEHGNVKKNRRIITSEIIYYWMASYGIPFECEHWNLNRLITLLRVCDIENSPPKKMSPQEAAKQRMALNNERLKRMGKQRRK